MRALLAPALLLVLTTAARAELEFAQPQADVGEVRSGQPLAHAFRFVNHGPEPVEIVSAQPSCGCLIPRLERRVFQPGETGSLQLDVNTLAQSAGPHTWRVDVTYRTGAAINSQALQLSARVIAEITIEPATLVIFASGPVRHRLLLTDRRAHPLTVTGLQTSTPSLQARLGSASTDAVGHRTQEIALDVQGGGPAGRHEEALSITTDDAGCRGLRVPVTVVWRGREPVSAAPAEVTLQAAGRAEVSRIVLLRGADGAAVAVEGVTSDDPAIRCRWAAGPGSMATVRISIDPQRVTGGTLHSAVVVRLARPAGAVVTIPVTCTTR